MIFNQTAIGYLLYFIAVGILMIIVLLLALPTLYHGSKKVRKAA